MIDKKQLHEEVKAHWQENLQKAKAGHLRLGDIYSTECAFCAIYLSNNCIGCPISEKTGFLLCGDTPWSSIAVAMTDGNQDELITAVEEMCKFLDDLNV